MSDVMLEIKDLVVEFDTSKGRRRVVDGVNFCLRQGEVLGVLGESGSGKTVSTLSALGLVPGHPGVISGQVLLYDKGQQIDLLADLDSCLTGEGAGLRKNTRRWNKIVRRRMEDRWGRVMTAVFQNPKASLDPLQTIGRQVEESIRLAHPSFDKKDVYERCIRWLSRVRLNDPERVHKAYAHELSGGMCQRAMIAVALSREPMILVADEPTTGLDSTVRAEIVELFRSLIEEEARSMIYISHDIREVLYLARRVVVMRGGKVVEEETADRLRLFQGQRAEYTQSLLSAAGIVPKGAPHA